MDSKQQNLLVNLVSSAHSLALIPGASEVKDLVLASIRTLFPAVSAATDAEAAEVALFLWCRANGFNILAIAEEQVTPVGTLTPREEALAMLDQLIEARRDLKDCTAAHSQAANTEAEAEKRVSAAKKAKATTMDALNAALDVCAGAPRPDVAIAGAEQ